MELQRLQTTYMENRFGGRPVGRKPVIILPGFMSSGLQVIESEICPRWNEKRIWLSLHRLGFTGKMLGVKDNEIDVDAETTVRMKDNWLAHMTLNHNDLVTESPGVVVRAVPGLRGVDYLEPGTLTNAASYVFGPVIKALVKYGGYEEGHSLDALPYDWRVPPHVLEDRDQYFTKALQRIERMRIENGGKPVTLLCHSMGCLVGHYLLAFANAKKGRIWVDTNIDTFMPVGGPFLGAPTVVQGVIVGTQMGLPQAFLNPHAALVMGRSLGSILWLLPKEKMTKNFVVEKHSSLRIVIQSVDVWGIMNQYNDVSKLRLRLKFNDNKYCTPWFRPMAGNIELRDDSGEQQLIYEFALPPNLTGNEFFEIEVQEQGVTSNETYSDDSPGCCCCCYCCGICLVKKILKGLFVSTLWGVNKASINAGYVVTSGKFLIAQLMGGQNQRVVTLQLNPVNTVRARNRKNCSATVTMNVEWQNFETINQMADTRPSPNDSLRVGDEPNYEWMDLFKLEGLNGHLQAYQNHYLNDPLINSDCPGVKNVTLIYGINSPTEIGSSFKRATFQVVRNKLYPSYELDISKKESDNPQYIYKGGNFYETKNTRQHCLLTNQTVEKSGDGTVPLQSLQHPITWAGQTNLTVKEIPNVDHRGILADEYFHVTLLNYLLFDASCVGEEEVQIALE